ncbi:hypothetical protein C8J57DRAFT_1089900, partial [Mycena rebaudengoi]
MRVAILQQQLEQQVNQGIQGGPAPPPEPDPNAPILAPLAESAVSAADRALMSKVRDEWMKVEVETCSSCHEQWFDLEVQDGKCAKCRSKKYPTKYQESNKMFPGLAPHLPPLTQMEEMLLSPVHALVALYQIRG